MAIKKRKDVAFKQLKIKGSFHRSIVINALRVDIHTHSVISCTKETLKNQAHACLTFTVGTIITYNYFSR